MKTVSDTIDRTFRDWLEHADELWVRTVIPSGVDGASTTVGIELSVLGPEERDLLAPGIIVEAGLEQMLIVAVNGANLTVRRGARGTQATEHPAGAELMVAPTYTRSAVYDAVADSLVDLHPPLFVSRVVSRNVRNDGVVFLPDDCITPAIVRFEQSAEPVRFQDLGQWPDGGGILNRAIMIERYGGGVVQVVYRGKILRPETEADTLTSLGCREEWERIVVVGAVAGLVASKPTSTSWQNYVAGQLQSEAYPVDTPNRIRDALIRYHSFLVERAAGSLDREHPQNVVLT